MAEQIVSLPMDFLARKLKMSAVELAEALKIGEGDEALSADSLRNLESKIDSIFESKFDEGKSEGHGEAKRKVLTDAEKAFAEKYNVPKGTFDEMADSLLKGKVSKEKLSPNDIRNTDTYLQDIKQRDEEIQTLKSQFDEVQGEYTRHRVSRVARNKFIEALEGYDLSNDSLVELVLDKALNEHKAVLSDDGKDILLTDENGQRIRTNGRDFLTWEDHVSSFGEKFFKQGGNPNPTPGGKTKPPGGGTKYHFKNQEEANEAFEKAESQEEKAQIVEAVQEQQQNW